MVGEVKNALAPLTPGGGVSTIGIKRLELDKLDVVLLLFGLTLRGGYVDDPAPGNAALGTLTLSPLSVSPARVCDNISIADPRLSLSKSLTSTPTFRPEA
jgi:hypothetical protein